MFKEGYKFYQESLTDSIEKNYYQEIYLALKSRNSSLNVTQSKISIARLLDIVKYVYFDNPSFFYVDPYLCQYDLQKENLIFHYIYDEKETADYENQVIKEIEPILNKNTNNYQHILDDYHFLVQKYSYNFLEEKEHFENTYDMISIFKKHFEECNGLAVLFKLLCDYQNIPCFIVLGYLKSIGKYHTWNMVKYENNFYHLDVTRGIFEKDGGGKFGIYTHFMVNDQWIKKDRDISSNCHYPLSTAEIDNLFFEKNHLVISSLDQLKDYFYQELPKSTSEIAVYIKSEKNISSMLIQRELSQILASFKNEHLEFKKTVNVLTRGNQYNIVRVLIGE